MKQQVTVKAGKMTEFSIGKQLSSLREKAGLSQVQLADALGTSQQNISAYENDIHTPSPMRLIQIARVLSVSVEELLLVETPAQEQVPE